MSEKTNNEFLIIAKRNKKMNDKILSLDRKYSKMLWLRKEKLEAKKQREIARFESKWKKSMERELHNLTHKRQRKEPVDKSVGKLKYKALKLIQRYRKLKYSVYTTNGIYVLLFDTGKRVPLDKNVHWWHCFSKWRYRWMMFDERNIYPISSWGNKQQLDNTGERIINIPKEDRYYLKKLSKKKQSIIYTRSDYEEIIEKYTKLVEIEEERLAINKKKDKVNTTKVD